MKQQGCNEDLTGKGWKPALAGVSDASQSATIRQVDRCATGKRRVHIARRYSAGPAGVPGYADSLKVHLPHFVGDEQSREDAL
ncbi:UNVERIFIED_ORG: hypothetical protein GGE55_001663 [Rhizobium esperanzae]